MMKKHVALLLTVLMMLCSVFVLAETESTISEAQKAEWTVMIYLCGTDLESDGAMASGNLTEIAQMTPNDSVNVVIETGGTKQWYAQDVGLDIDPKKLQRYSYDENGYALVEEAPLQNMASADTLSDFVSWGKANYPAEKYMLVLWDHGGGSVTGLIVDELHDNAVMSLDELQRGLEQSGVQLEALLLDTCLMATLETAQAAQSTTHYMIASQETVPGQGTDYKSWLQKLYNDPECDGQRFGRKLCDAVQQKYAELNDEYSSKFLTYSVIDLTKLDAVSAAFDQMFIEVGGLLADPNAFFDFGNAITRAEHYTYPTMVDLYNMAELARGNGVSNATVNKLTAAIEDAVVYNIKGLNRSYSHGLSFYYEPSAHPYQLDHYARACKSAAYLAYLDAVNLSWTAPQWVYEQTARLPEVSYDDYMVEVETSVIDNDLHLIVTNAKDAVTAVDALIYQHDADSDMWIKLGSSWDVSGSFMDGEFVSNFGGYWPALNGQFCMTNVQEETDSYILYNIPAYIEDYKVTNLRAGLIFYTPLSQQMEELIGNADAGEYVTRGILSQTLENEAQQQEAKQSEKADDGEPSFGLNDLNGLDLNGLDPNGYYELYGVYCDVDTALNMPGRDTFPMSELVGRQMALMMTVVDIETGEELGTGMGDLFDVTDNMSLDTQELPKGEYAFSFEVKTVLGKTITTQPVTFTWDGEKAVFEDENAE